MNGNTIKIIFASSDLSANKIDN